MVLVIDFGVSNLATVRKKMGEFFIFDGDLDVLSFDLD